MKSARKNHLLNFISSAVREHAESLALALVVAFVIRIFVASAFIVRSDSMMPTVKPGDLIVGFKLPFFGAAPKIKRNQLVIHRCPGQRDYYCLKRVIAQPGDRIQMINQRLNLNGETCKYAQGKSTGRILIVNETCGENGRRLLISENWQEESWGPSMVPPGSFFVLNDNRSDGSDSRSWGPLAADLLIAEGMFVWISFDWGAPAEARWFPSIRWSRALKRLH